jgi:hypothetical protein
MKKEEETLMNKGIWSLGLVVLIALMFFTVGSLKAGDKTTPPDEVVIQNAGYKRDKKSPVKLSHKTHSDKKKDNGYGVNCADCHHDYKDGKNVWKEGDPVKKCSECHSPLETVSEGDTKIYKLNLAYHKNCKNCHKKVVEEDSSKKAPYKKCNDCHEKD